MKKILKVKGMHCNSCSILIENELKKNVNKVSANFSSGEVTIDYDSGKISEKQICKKIESLGYSINNDEKIDYMKWIVLGGTFMIVLFTFYTMFGSSIDFSGIQLPEIGQSTSLILLFLVGILTGFHCVSMCGGFVVSYTAKNAIKGHKGFDQHLVYGGAKVISYTIIGAFFGLIGGIFAFSTILRGWIAIFAGVFMIFYSLSMFGIGFFRKFQFNPKFLTRAVMASGHSAKGPYSAPIVTGLLNGLFIACGPLQAMYLYAAGTGSAISGGLALMAFGLGTLPVMLIFGSLATVISHKTTQKILKFSAVIVLILGLIMLNRGLALTGSSFSFDSIKEAIAGVPIDSASSILIDSDGKQVINMDVSAAGYSPNSFVLKKGVSVKWNINVKELTGCNSELVVNDYKIYVNLKPGINVIEFMPDKTGTIRFSCGMGMLRGSFIVTDDGQATQAQAQALTPVTSHVCGGSSGSCGGSCGGCGGGCGA